MSTTLNSKTEPDWHGEGVTIAEVLTALNDIRRKLRGRRRETTSIRTHVTVS